MNKDNTWAIIPAKPLYRAKSRLARALKSSERAALVRSMLLHTLDVLSVVKGITGIVVVSTDRAVHEITREKNAIALVETGSGLNSAVLQAKEWLVSQHDAPAVLIVPLDLPLLTTSDIESMLDLAFGETCVVIAPDRRDEGSNALLLRPPDVITPAFGPSSFETHRMRATARNIPVRAYRSATIALDIDLPDDLDRFNKLSALLHTLSPDE